MALKRISYTKNLSGYINRNGTEYLLANSDCLADVIEFLNANTHIGLHVSNFIGKYKRKNLDFLEKCKNLPHLYIQDGIEDISAVKKVSGLKSFILLEDIVCSDFSAWEKLEYFEGVYHQSMVNMENCASLHKVSLRKVSTKTKTVNDLPLPLSIESITFTRGNLISLDGLQKYNHIKTIELNYLINLMDITTLNSLRNLQFLEMESCKKALDVEVLSNIAYLHTLKLTNCGVLNNLNFIQDLKRLKFFTFIDTKLKSGDLTPLTCHPSLEYAGFMSSRDYNYSFDQIQEMLQKKK